MGGDPGLRTLLDGRGQPRVASTQRIHSVGQPQRIQLVDSKGSVAALRAAPPAGKPLSGPPHGALERRIHCPYKLQIAFWSLHYRQHTGAARHL
jgi:hypothetical protein